MNRKFVHATEIRVLPGEKEAERFLDEIKQRDNCISASYRRLKSNDLAAKELEMKDKETVDFLLKLTDLNVPVYLFEWDVVGDTQDRIR